MSSHAGPQEWAVLWCYHGNLEPALHQHQESHLMAILPQRHQLHQLPHCQHGKISPNCLFVVLLSYCKWSLNPVCFTSDPSPGAGIFCLTWPLSIVLQLSKMHPDEYQNIIKRLESHYQEFMRSCQGSEMFGEEEKKTMQGNFDKAQKHYTTLVIQLPTHSES